MAETSTIEPSSTTHWVLRLTAAVALAAVIFFFFVAQVGDSGWLVVLGVALAIAIVLVNRLLPPITIRESGTIHWVFRACGAAILIAFVYHYYLDASATVLGNLIEACILAIAAVSLNLLLGFNGQISIGHSTFVGLGAFGAGYAVNNLDWNPYVSLLLALVLCFLLGLALGLPALRLKGPYLALVTLAVAFVWPTIANIFLEKKVKSTKLNGLRLKPPSWTQLKSNRLDTAVYLYIIAVVLLVLSYVVVRNLRKSRIGRSLVAVRDNETAAAVMGVNLKRTKTITFGISAAIAGAAGWLTAAYLATLTVETFTIRNAIVYLLALFLGGAATMSGPIVGAFVYYFLNKYLIEHAKNWHWLPGPFHKGGVAPFLLGVLVIAFVFIAPFGIVGYIKAQARRFFVVAPRPLQLTAAAPVLTDHPVDEQA